VRNIERDFAFADVLQKPAWFKGFCDVRRPASVAARLTRREFFKPRRRAASRRTRVFARTNFFSQGSAKDARRDRFRVGIARIGVSVIRFRGRETRSGKSLQDDSGWQRDDSCVCAIRSDPHDARAAVRSGCPSARALRKAIRDRLLRLEAGRTRPLGSRFGFVGARSCAPAKVSNHCQDALVARKSNA
jgi:hypothetical protein